MVKLLALDIDGTLTDNNGIINDKALAAVRAAREQGLVVALISARPPQGIEEVARRLGGAVERVAYFGALIQDAQGQEVQRLLLDSEIARQIARFGDSRGFSVMINIDDTEYQSQQQQRHSAAPRVAVGQAESALQASRPPVLISFEGAEPAAAFDAYCAAELAGAVGLYRHFTPDGSYISTLAVHPEADKGTALAAVCRRLAIDPADVLAIGDSESDSKMFHVAGLGVAVANAPADVHAAADHVAPLAHGEGVLWVLQQFVTPAAGA